MYKRISLIDSPSVNWVARGLSDRRIDAAQTIPYTGILSSQTDELAYWGRIEADDLHTDWLTKSLDYL